MGTYIQRPIADITPGWGTVVGAASRWQAIDEVTNDVADYIQGAGGQVYECLLGPAQAPASNTGGSVVVWAIAGGTGPAERITVAVYHGATLLATPISSATVGRTGWTQFSGSLSADNLNSITDWSNVRLRMTATGSESDAVLVSQAYMVGGDAPISGSSGRVKTSTGVLKPVKISTGVAKPVKVMTASGLKTLG
jgi:hypothetical protein